MVGLRGTRCLLVRRTSRRNRKTYSTYHPWHRLSSMSTPNVTACVGETKTQRRYNSSSVSLFDGDHGAKFVYDRSSEVQAAKLLRQPVVALETTIYTHGFPYPENLDLALSLEQIVRDNGGVPATVGIIDSQICVGMSKDQITRLASSAGKPETMKVSRRDIPYIIGMGIAGRRICGGTTVSGTMMIARNAGIEVFGTGGLGGVHRGGEDTMDISADLTELGRTPVAVISSGCKSFLDLPRTLEYLETQGVSVCTFADGRTGEVDLPSFYTRESGIKSPLTIQTAREAAAMIYVAFTRLHNATGGLLFANPIPEEFSIPKAEIDLAINQAIQEAADQGFHGHLNTPFILSRIKDLTMGNSIPANRALIESNVKMATQVAVELEALKQEYRRGRSSRERAKKLAREAVPTGGISKIIRQVRENKEQSPADALDEKFALAEAVLGGSKISNNNDNNVKLISPDLVVFGSLAVDLACDYTVQAANQDAGAELIMKTSNPSAITQTIGGVGHNVALAAHMVSGGSKVRLCSLVGADLTGKAALKAIKTEGLDLAGILTLPDARTAQYVAVNDSKKDLAVAMADMNIISDGQPEPSWVLSNAESAKWAVVDGNWNATEMHKILSTLKTHKQKTKTRFAQTHNFKPRDQKIKTAFEPVSVYKAANLFRKSTYHGTDKVVPLHLVDLATPNVLELTSMWNAAKQNGYFESQEWWERIDALGISGATGARHRFEQITNRKLTDEGIPLQTVQLLPFIPSILTKLGAEGVLLTHLLSPGDYRLRDPNHAKYIVSQNMSGSEVVGGVYMRLFPAVEHVEDVVSVNGVGDTFLGILVAGLTKGVELDETLINIAQRGAVMTLRSKESVSPRLKTLAGELDVLGSYPPHLLEALEREARNAREG